MTNKQILQKAIKKAIENGWSGIRLSKHYVWKGKRGVKASLIEKYVNENITTLESIIFSHDFAKAFWGEGEYDYPYTKPDGKEVFLKGTDAWKHNLQQMVLEENPLSYLERFLGEGSD